MAATPALLVMLVYLTVFIMVIAALWRGMKALESIAVSLRKIAQDKSYE